MRSMLLLPALLLTACVPQQQADNCATYGFYPGTSAYAECRMQFGLQEQAIRGALASQLIGRPMVQYHPVPLPPPVQATPILQPYAPLRGPFR